MVVPTINEFIETPYSLRRGLLAAIVLNHVVDHIAQQGFLSEKRPKMDERIDYVRKRLLQQCPEFQLIHDVANVTKHAKLAISTKSNSTQRELTDSKNVIATAGFFQAPFGEGVFLEASEVVVTLQDGTSRALLPIVKAVFAAIPSIL